MMAATTRKNRQTGTRITVGSREEVGQDLDEMPYFTICEDHGFLVGHETRKLAQSHAPVPAEWCEECQRLHEAGEQVRKTLNAKKVLAALVELARSWGGEVREVTLAEYEAVTDGHYPEYSEAPFTHYSLGVSWHEGVVYIATEDLAKSYQAWPDVIHEMGHVFATETGALGYDHEPDAEHEFDFFGWEYVVTQYVGGDTAVWLKAQGDYSVELADTGNDTDDFGTLPFQKKFALLKERVQAAIDKGTVKREGGKLIPASLRRDLAMKGSGSETETVHDL